MVRASPRRRGKSSRSGAAERRVGRDGGPAVRGETSVPRGKFRWYRGFVFALSQVAWGGFLFPPERGAGARPDGRGGGALRWRSGGLYSRWRAGWSAALWGLVQCTPHSLFCEKRECAVHGGREKTGARHGTDCLIRMSLPAAWCKRGFWWLLNRLPSLFAAANLAGAGLAAFTVFYWGSDSGKRNTPNR